VTGRELSAELRRRVFYPATGIACCGQQIDLCQAALTCAEEGSSDLSELPVTVTISGVSFFSPWVFLVSQTKPESSLAHTYQQQVYAAETFLNTTFVVS
jgi:hypothetical protein